MTTMTLSNLAQELQAEFVGDPGLEITRVVHPLQAATAQDLALVLDEKIINLLANCPVKTALVPLGLTIDTIPNQIKVKRPRYALARLLEIFDKPVYVAPGVHPSSVVDPTAILEEGVSIGPLCSVGPGTVIGAGTRLVSHVSIGQDVRIGQLCILYAGVRVGDRVEMGNRVIIQPNAAIGSDGYSYATPEAGSVESARATGRVEAQNTQIARINSIGTVILEDEVEIGANSCIDRATLGETRIKRGAKLDNLVQVAHNVTIGENCLIVGQAGIAGSTKIGDRTVIAGQAGIPDHVTIGEDSVIMPRSGVTGDVPPKSILAGAPAIPRREFLYREMQIKRIKGLSQKIDELSKKLEAMESQFAKEEQPV
jgi:UDP-3-O-[3-hydroxymyristoyl] glucosamine N-acyltransferase